MVIQIPTVGTEGYLNFKVIWWFLAALILGKGGFIVGGFGSALAD